MAVWVVRRVATALRSQREHMCGLARFATRRIGSAIDRAQNSIDRTGRMDGNLEVGVAMLQHGSYCPSNDDEDLARRCALPIEYSSALGME